jgi:copper chaperone CopZ
MNIRARALLILACGLLLPARAAAGVQEVAVPVSGMTCALCTRGVEESIRRLRGVGVEESIRRLRGVGTATADLDSGRVRVTVGKEHPLDLDEVRKSVKEAGFEVAGECDLVATGRFAVGEERRMTFAISDTPLRYRVLENNQTLLLFRAHPDLEGHFSVRFRLHNDSRWDPPTISMRSFEPLGGAK